VIPVLPCFEHWDSASSSTPGLRNGPDRRSIYYTTGPFSTLLDLFGTSRHRDQTSTKCLVFQCFSMIPALRHHHPLLSPPAARAVRLSRPTPGW
jgi:hypothetical protein